MSVLRVYTDGACSGNPGPGGWAALLMYGKRVKEISGFEPHTTNNRMELQAVIEGLSSIKVAVPVEVYSDSKYFIDAMNQGWLANWQRNNWKKGTVKNIDLWEQIIELDNKYKPKYIWVKGHADNPYNNRCDELAVAAIKDNRK